MLIKGKILSSNLIGEKKPKKKKTTTNNTGLNAVICFGRSENGSRVSKVNRKICV